MNDGAIYILKKNKKKILDLIIEDLINFSISNQIKSKSLSSLFFLIEACQNDLIENLDEILLVLYKHFDNDEIEINKKVNQIANILGTYLNSKILIGTICKHINDSEVKNSLNPISARIRILSNVLINMKDLENPTISLILQIIEGLDIYNLSDSVYTKSILIDSFNIFANLTENLKENCKTFHSSLFYNLLLLGSIPDLIDIRKEVNFSMNTLSKNCGFDKREDMFSLELGIMLEKFKESHKNWRNISPDRFAFDTYVRNAGNSLGEHWVDILLIIADCVENDKDLEMKMDMIILIDSIIENPDLHSQLSYYIDFIVPEILLPCCVWRPTKPTYKVRKAAIVCLMGIYTNQLYPIENSLKHFGLTINMLKSAMDDDWDPELRFLGIRLLTEMILLLKEKLDNEALLEIYPLALKRLDDSQDKNRIQVCKTLKIFFEVCLKVSLSDSIFDYIIKSALIHLDDPNIEVRNSVYSFLKIAKEVNKENFLKQAKESLQYFNHPDLLQKLINE